MARAEPGTPVDEDIAAFLGEEVRRAKAEGRSLYLQGGGSKLRRLGRRCDAEPLSVAGHRGIVEYRPAELIMTARAGTPLRELREVAESENQRLAFEAPEFEGAATLGGTLASNSSGPARPWTGSVRDAVLGIRILNGEGEELRFGGEVIKNVAGYDVSRLQAGALGCLGLITEVSFRLLPAPAAQLHLVRPCTAEDAVPFFREFAARPLPLSGACWHRGVLRLRLAGSEAAMNAVHARYGEFTEEDGDFWTGLREWQLPELEKERPLWMLDLAPATPASVTGGLDLIDWGGARRYLDGTVELSDAAQIAKDTRGQLQGLWGGDRSGNTLPEPAPVLRGVLERVKAAVDPERVFNPGRLHAWL